MSNPNSSLRINGISMPKPVTRTTTVAMFPAKGRFLPSGPMLGFKFKKFRMLGFGDEFAVSWDLGYVSLHSDEI